MSLSNILIIDSATGFLSVALVNEEATLALEYSHQINNHAKAITVFIDKALAQSRIRYKDISAIAINKGPGSFTGLRVGSSTAKGLCFALDVPLIAVDGLKEYAEYIYEKNQGTYTDVFLMLDARRGNYFFSHKNEHREAEISKFQNEKEIEALINQSKMPLKFIINHQNADELRCDVLKKSVFKKMAKSDFEDIELFEPLYLLNNYQKQK